MGDGQVIWGNDNVQISHFIGSSIQITYGGNTRLVPLEPAVVAIGPKVSAPGRVLRARAGVIPYTVHRGLLEDLVAWCHKRRALCRLRDWRQGRSRQGPASASSCARD